MKKGYGTYCPVSLAAEIVGERWTIPLLLVLADDPSLRFNEMRRAMPRIPPSTLTQRLRTLEEAGLVRKRKLRGEEGHAYSLSEAGRDLEPILHDLGHWGHRWARDLARDDLDTRTLGWSIHHRLDTGAMPAGRTVIEFDFSGEASHCSRFWIVHRDGRVDVCEHPPGYPVDVRVSGELGRFVDAWRGFRSMEREIRSGGIRVEAEPALRRAFPGWLLLSAAAPTERMRPGRERRLRRSTERRGAGHGTMGAPQGTTHGRRAQEKRP